MHCMSTDLTIELNGLCRGRDGGRGATHSGGEGMGWGQGWLLLPRFSLSTVPHGLVYASSSESADPTQPPSGSSSYKPVCLTENQQLRPCLLSYQLSGDPVTALAMGHSLKSGTNACECKDTSRYRHPDMGPHIQTHEDMNNPCLHECVLICADARLGEKLIDTHPVSSTLTLLHTPHLCSQTLEHVSIHKLLSYIQINS